MRYVALLRAVNVGKRRIKMADLRLACEEIGLGNVTTHIQSGNVIFDSRKQEPALVSLFETELERRFGFAVPTMIRTAAGMTAAAAQWPYSEPAQGSSGFVGFLNTEPEASKAAVLAGAATDQLTVIGRHLYWLRHDRDTDFDNNRAERALGVTSTLRNLAVTRRLAELVTADS